MKVLALIAAASIATTSAFTVVPSSQARYGTALSAKEEKEGGNSIFTQISNMDLFAPNKNINTYGARKSKNVGVGKIEAGKSYVPDGLTTAQYSKVRANEAAKKDQNYDRNVKKAFKFQDYTEFYLKRGTELSQGWIKEVTRGHEMVKTKYDWSGKTQQSKGWFSPPTEKKADPKKK
jgi:hypothetical protein